MGESGDDASTIPATIGIGLRAPHLAEIIATRPVVGWLEVHPENCLGGGAAPARLATVCRDYPLSLHGVGLSLGSAEGIDAEHLARGKAPIERAPPSIVSEHLSWSVTGGTYFNDLLPLPYTEESLDVVATNVARLQEALGRRVLVENPSSYLRFQHSTIAEPDFLAALWRPAAARRRVGGGGGGVQAPPGGRGRGGGGGGGSVPPPPRPRASRRRS